jgi:D-tyrosyl-tRNA(Tyr) deacylase
VVSRVDWARVVVGGEVAGEIGPGLLVLVGVGHDDGPAEAGWLAGKVAALRVFDDEAGQMNRSLTEAGGGALVVSQRRPGHDPARQRQAVLTPGPAVIGLPGLRQGSCRRPVPSTSAAGPAW